jgi:pyrroline-5-carboxylate reductase
MGSFERVGILGIGNMGTALLEGLFETGASAFEATIFDQDDERVWEGLNEFDVDRADSPEELFDRTDFVVLCVKPKDVDAALADLGGEPVNLVSIAAGVSLDKLEGLLPDRSAVIRVMPNTPAQVGEGMSFLAPGSDVSDSFLDAARSVFDGVGKTDVVEENQLDAVTALSGSGPAYVFYFLEALQEAGVYLGLDDEQSLEASLQTLLGSGKLVQETGQSPAELRRQVSSPGGTTVEALQTLDEDGVKGKIKAAIREAFRKSRSMGDTE